RQEEESLSPPSPSHRHQSGHAGKAAQEPCRRRRGWPGMQYVVDRQLALRGVAPQRRDRDAITSRHEGIRQEYAPARLVRNPERQLMVAAGLRRQRHDGSQLNRSLSTTEVVESGKG